MKFFSHPAITDTKAMRTLYRIDFSVDTKSWTAMGTRTSRSHTPIEPGRLAEVHIAPKCATEPFWYVTLHFRERRGAASPRYKSRAKTTVLMETHPILRGLEAEGFWNDRNWL